MTRKSGGWKSIETVDFGGEKLDVGKVWKLRNRKVVEWLIRGWRS